MVAAAGTAVYIAGFHSAAPAGHAHASPLPSRVVGYQTVGLIAEPGPASTAGNSMAQLLAPARTPKFVLIGPAAAQQGDPEWTADLMAGDTYIFIYVPTSQCLASAGPATRPALTIQHCNLDAAQRWRRMGRPVEQDQHDYYQFANVASSRCIAQLGGPVGQPAAAGLEICDPSEPASQLIGFWWAAD